MISQNRTVFLFLIPAVCCVAVLASFFQILPSATKVRPESNIIQVEGYANRVMDLVKDKILFVEKMEAKGGASKLIVSVNFSKMRKTDREFYESSRLPADIEQVNTAIIEGKSPEGDGGLLLIGERLSVHRGGYALRLPFSAKSKPVERGKLTVDRGDLLGGLMSLDLKLLLRPRSDDSQNLSIRPVDIFADTGEFYSSEFLVIDGPVARLAKLVAQDSGDASLEILPGSWRFFVNGKLIKSKTVLKDGDKVGIERQEKRNSFVYHQKTEGEFKGLSFESITANSRGLGAINSAAIGSDFQGIVDDVRRSTDSFSPKQFALVTDLDLERSVQAVLGTYISEKFSTPESELNFPASVTLMDTDTGRILALASYPLDSESTSKLGIPRRNENFISHVIGSVGKPFFCSAMWHCYPELAELRIREMRYDNTGLKVDSVLGTLFSPSFRDIFPQNNLRPLLGVDPRYSDGRYGKHAFFAYSINSFFLSIRSCSQWP